MATTNEHEYEHDEEETEEVMLDPDEAGEEVIDYNEDAPMESDDEEEIQIQLQNDSVAHFDLHKDSIFAITQHPTIPNLIATGGGDDTGYLFDLNTAPPPASQERASIPALLRLDGHADSLNALTFTLPTGQFLLTGGLDGQLRAYAQDKTVSSSYSFLASSQEVEEINFLAPCPHPQQPNVVALGASDGSVWVYRLGEGLDIVQAYYMHTGPCTAGAWTPDGKLLATVSEDGTFYVWDVFGEAAAAGVTAQAGSQSLIGLTPLDERFKVEGGLYSIAISPGGSLAAVGGAEGNIRVVGLPRFTSSGASTSSSSSSSSSSKHATSKTGTGTTSRPSGARNALTKSNGNSNSGGGDTGQMGLILASIQTQSDSIETLSFSQPPVTLLAAGSVDGSITVFDASRAFAVRRTIKDAHDAEAVIQVQFVKPLSTASQALGAPASTASEEAWILTSAGNDGVVRRWDLRGGATAAAGGQQKNQGLIGEWKGHRGGGEGGGVLAFVQGGGGGTVVTAGDDAVALVYKMT